VKELYEKFSASNSTFTRSHLRILVAEKKKPKQEKLKLKKKTKKQTIFQQFGTTNINLFFHP